MNQQHYIGEYTVGALNRMTFGGALGALLEAAEPLADELAISECPFTLRLDQVVTVEPVFQHRSGAGKDEDCDYDGERHIRELAAALRNMPTGEKRLDPILVTNIDGTWVCIDGHHRLKAYAAAGVTNILVTAFPGKVAEAVVAAGAGNSKAKLPMSKRDRMSLAWRLTAAKLASKSETVVIAAVADGTVANMRKLRKRLATRGIDPTNFDYYEARELDKGGEIGERGEDWEERQVARMENTLSKAFGKNAHRNRDFIARALENRYPSLIDTVMERNALGYRETIQRMCWEEDDCRD